MYKGDRWGIECKMLYTDTLDSQCDAITKAAKQLEDSRCQFGVIAVNVANIFPHDAVFDLTMKTARTSPQATTFANNFQTDWMKRFDKLLHERSGLYQDRQTGRPRNKTRAIFFFCPMTINVNFYPTLYCCVTPLFVRQIEHNERTLFTSFKKAAVTALTFVAPPNGDTENANEEPPSGRAP